MRNQLKQKGFGLLGLIITIAIIVLLVFGFKQLGGQSEKNQIEAGRDAIDQAKEAQDLQMQSDINLQNQVQDPQPVNYHGIQDNLKNINH